jgi:hypothetical protein
MEKQLLLKKMLLELNDLPVVYLKHWYELIHTFRQTLTTKEPLDSQAMSDFDWDDFIEEVSNSRRSNNQRLADNLSILSND